MFHKLRLCIFSPTRTPPQPPPPHTHTYAYIKWLAFELFKVLLYVDMYTLTYIGQGLVNLLNSFMHIYTVIVEKS